MPVVRDKAAAVISLLLEQEGAGHTQMANLNHQIVQGLIVLAIETLFRIRIHGIN